MNRHCFGTPDKVGAGSGLCVRCSDAEDTSAFRTLVWDDPFMRGQKPRVGSGSHGVYVLSDQFALDAVMKMAKHHPEFLPGDEYSVDLYVGQSGAVHAVVRDCGLKVDSGVAITKSHSLRLASSS